MELSEVKMLQNMPNVVAIVIETLYYHSNMNLLALFVVTM